jgi:hypothetical protein
VSSNANVTALPVAGPFGRLPNAVARDAKLTAAALVTIAWRITVATDRASFGLSAGALARSLKGMGRDVAQCAIAAARDMGYLERAVRTTSTGKIIGGNNRGSDGTWSTAKDALTPKALTCGESGKAGRHIRRAWLEAHDYKVIAVWLYLQAGTGAGPVLRREVEKRFGWNRGTARKYLRRAVKLGLAKEIKVRGANGQYQRDVFHALPFGHHGQKLGDGVDPAMDKNHATVPHVTVFQATNVLPSEEPSQRTPNGESPARTQRGNYTFRSSTGEVLTLSEISKEDFCRIRSDAESNARLLGWESEDRPHGEQAFNDVVLGSDRGSDGFAEILRRLPIENGIEALRTETGGRVHPEIASPAGVYTLAFFAAFLMGADEEETLEANEALGMVLLGIKDRIGNQEDAWLNSLKLIGERLLGGTSFGESYYDTQRPFYASEIMRPTDAPMVGAEGFEWQDGDAFTIAVPGTARLGCRDDPLFKQLYDALTRIREVDLNGYIHASLFKGSFFDELRELLDRYGNDLFVDTVRTMLWRGMTDGAKPGYIRTWRYFEAACAEQEHLQSLEQSCERPGDVFGAHRFKSGGG